ncbi:hypothetical protein K0M31_001030, partial [Melipona bicolor]
MVEEREHGWRDREPGEQGGGERRRQGKRKREEKHRSERGEMPREKDRGGKGGAIQPKKNRRWVVRCNPRNKPLLRHRDSTRGSGGVRRPATD